MHSMNPTHTDFLDLFTVTVAFNFAYVIRESFEKKGFFGFIDLFTKSKNNQFNNLKSKKLENVKSFISLIESIVTASPELENLAIKLKREIKPTEDRVTQVLESAGQSHSKISKIEHISSACFLLGLYGILILFITPHFTMSPNIDVFLFNMNSICLFFLLWCLLWDITITCNDNKFSCVICRMIFEKICEPKRRYAILLFLFICGFGIAYFEYDLYNWGVIKIPHNWLKWTYFFTIATCFSPFIIYSIYFFGTSAFIEIKCRIYLRYLTSNSDFKSAYKEMEKQRKTLNMSEFIITNEGFTIE